METIASIVAELKAQSDAKNLDGMARFGISPDRAFGTRMPVLRRMGKALGRDHALAMALWDCGYRETQILAGLVADPARMTADVMDAWTSSFSYWEICDQSVMNCFEHTPLALPKCFEYAESTETFIKRTGFVLMARLAAFHKEIDEQILNRFIQSVENHASDPRVMVKKSVSWALREIGKRSMDGRQLALLCADKLAQSESTAERWVARDVERDLSSPAALRRAKRFPK